MRDPCRRVSGLTCLIPLAVSHVMPLRFIPFSAPSDSIDEHGTEKLHGLNPGGPSAAYSDYVPPQASSNALKGKAPQQQGVQTGEPPTHWTERWEALGVSC